MEVQGSPAHPSSVPSDYLCLELGGPSCHPQAEGPGEQEGTLKASLPKVREWSLLHFKN